MLHGKIHFLCSGEDNKDKSGTAEAKNSKPRKLFGIAIDDELNFNEHFTKL